VRLSHPSNAVRFTSRMHDFNSSQTNENFKCTYHFSRPVMAYDYTNF
jgi:hypothetical protein